MEFTKAEKISMFTTACEQSGEHGATIVLTHIFVSHAPNDTVNDEVNRKYSALVDFTEAVYRSVGGQASQIGKLGPRQYAEKIRDMHGGTNTHNNNIYKAIMIAGHHIRELTDRPEYVVPKPKPQVA